VTSVSVGVEVASGPRSVRIHDLRRIHNISLGPSWVVTVTSSPSRMSFQHPEKRVRSEPPTQHSLNLPGARSRSSGRLLA